MRSPQYDKELKAAEVLHDQTLAERDEAVDAFDRLCEMIEVPTEYSNVRGYEEILEDAQIALDNGVGKEWLTKHKEYQPSLVAVEKCLHILENCDGDLDFAAFKIRREFHLPTASPAEPPTALEPSE